MGEKIKITGSYVPQQRSTVGLNILESFMKKIRPHHSLVDVFSASPHLAIIVFTASSAMSKCVGMYFS